MPALPTIPVVVPTQPTDGLWTITTGVQGPPGAGWMDTQLELQAEVTALKSALQRLVAGVRSTGAEPDGYNEALALLVEKALLQPSPPITGGDLTWRTTK